MPTADTPKTHVDPTPHIPQNAQLKGRGEGGGGYSTTRLRDSATTYGVRVIITVPTFGSAWSFDWTDSPGATPKAVDAVFSSEAIATASWAMFAVVYLRRKDIGCGLS